MNKTLGNVFKGDKVIWMVFFFLCIISVVEVFSASSELTYKGGSYWAPMLKHIGILLLGIFFMVVTLNIQCRYFKLLTPFLLIISLVTLVWVVVAGSATNGAQRWISFFGMQFQPSEIAKGTLVLATAQILSAMQTDKGADKNAFKYVLWTSAIFIVLIAKENFSTAVLLGAVLVMMMIIGRVPMRQIGMLMGVVMLVAVGALSFIMLVGHENGAVDANRTLTEKRIPAGAQTEKKEGASSFLFHRADTWKGRVLTFVNNRDIKPSEVDLDKDAQTAHANIAIASSKVIGKGPGNSEERDFLSQAFSDFIYAIIIEELGIAGAVFVALLYIILLFRTGNIAMRCENNFPAFLAMGLALLLVTQALFNMCVAVGLVPVTGQPLPLISKGGTSSMINCIYIGAILSVSRSAKKKKDAGRQPEVQQAVEDSLSAKA